MSNAQITLKHSFIELCIVEPILVAYWMASKKINTILAVYYVVLLPQNPNALSDLRAIQ